MNLLIDRGENQEEEAMEANKTTLGISLQDLPAVKTEI